MSHSSWDARRFLAELKRRHVIRVLVVYAAVGFLLLQIMDLVVPALLLPDWTYRLVALLLMLGLPVALVITWAFEVTPEGLRRTEPAVEASPAARAATPRYRAAGTTPWSSYCSSAPGGSADGVKRTRRQRPRPTVP